MLDSYSYLHFTSGFLFIFRLKTLLGPTDDEVLGLLIALLSRGFDDCCFEMELIVYGKHIVLASCDLTL